MISLRIVVNALFILLVVTTITDCGITRGFRPPAVPLLVVDPQFSVWSPSVNLTDSFSTQWTGRIQAFVGLIRVDGQAYRFMGPSDQAGGAMPPAMIQTDLQIYPTTTIFFFKNDKVELQVHFSTPLLPTDYDLLSRPITFITIKVKPLGTHNIQLYLDNTGEIAVNKIEEEMNWTKDKIVDKDVTMNVMRIGTTEQKIFGVKGDGVGINWGYFYIGAPSSSGSVTVKQGIAPAITARQTFTSTGSLPSSDLQGPKRCNDGWPVLVTVWDLGSISTTNDVYVVTAYDDVYSIDFFGQKMKAYWTQKFNSITALMTQSIREYSSIISKLVTFNDKLVADLTRVGGDKYATIASVAYRQALGGMKLVYNDQYQMPWYFLKEISSDGDVSTVDVIYPASPILLYLKPELLYLQMLPIMAYANNETWSKYTYEFSPHHLGIYPVCDIKSEGQENMPIEETANMLQMWSAVIQREPSSMQIQQMTKKFWGLFATWANYLVNNLPDPGEQLCTDDFEGPSPHNANLAAKGIIGLAAYAQICSYMSKPAEADKYIKISRDYAAKWRELAIDTDKSHTKLEYDKSNTYSLKYNIYYQYVLNVSLFDPQPDIKYYLSQKFNKYGTPLDNRAKFTKLDWIYWTAAMGSDTQFAQFNEIGYNMAMDTTRGIPLTDWYETVTAAIKGFRARPVVGGIYARMVLK
jgi:hypothetical protein